MIPKTSDVGVIVGRFQVHRLHEAHRQLIDQIYSTHNQTVIVLGLSQARISVRNPLDFEARKQLLLAEYPKATIFYLKDQPSDDEWSRKLDAIIADYVSPTQTVCLYGGRDSFIAHYRGHYRTQELEPPAYVSGTELRKSISRSVRGSEDFRAGVIWAAANGYPRVFPTVDIAVYRNIYQDNGVTDPARAAVARREWLFVRKPNEQLWRFPGGFVSPADENLEQAARREVLEEVGVEVGSMRYVGSFLVDDWRYRDEADKIMTTLFATPYVFGPVRPADDVAWGRWIQHGDDVTSQLVPEHKPLWIALQKGGW